VNQQSSPLDMYKTAKSHIKVSVLSSSTECALLKCMRSILEKWIDVLNERDIHRLSSQWSNYIKFGNLTAKVTNSQYCIEFQERAINPFCIKIHILNSVAVPFLRKTMIPSFDIEEIFSSIFCSSLTRCDRCGYGKFMIDVRARRTLCFRRFQWRALV